MSASISFVQFVALVIAAFSCGIDVRQHRIPNWLTFGSAAAALAYHLATAGASGFVDAVGGWLVGFAIFFVPFALGGFGAGDVKLIAALGAWLGLADAVWLSLYVGLSGGLIALAVGLSLGYLRRAVANIGRLVNHWRTTGLGAHPELTIRSAGAPKLAYGVSILAGTVVTVWLR